MREKLKFILEKNDKNAMKGGEEYSNCKEYKRITCRTIKEKRGKY